MATHIDLGGIPVEVIQKDIKNIHLSVYPPAGRVRISAPRRMNLDAIRAYAISKLGWIKRHQQRIQAQARETPREYLDRESHYVWGTRYLLETVAADGQARVELRHSALLLHLRPGASEARKMALLAEWYRGLIRSAAPELIAKWQPRMGVQVSQVFVQRMKTRWGSCTPGRGSIRLNSELAKKPPQCLEYVVVHELAHLLEPSHNSRFVALMDGFLPGWKAIREELNRLPVRHEDWVY